MVYKQNLPPPKVGQAKLATMKLSQYEEQYVLVVGVPTHFVRRSRLRIVGGRLAASVVTPSDIQTGFNDIGALDQVKETLRELVMLPLLHPHLFQRVRTSRVAVTVVCSDRPLKRCVRVCDHDRGN